MNKIYVTSDLHFMHNRVFLYEPRGFSSVHDMNEAIIQNFNKIVDWTDDLYILGDCFLNDNEEGIKLMKRLPGTKHVVFGNHDTDTRKQLLAQEGFDTLGYASMLKHNNYHFYLSHYPTITSNYDVDKPLRRRVVNLCGHTHTKDPFCDFDKGLIYHCELDTNNNCPWLLDDIIENIKKQLDIK